jgi:hypothetical protein
LAKIIAARTVYLPGKNPVLERNSQFYGEEGIVSRWKKIPVDGPNTLHDDMAKQTALNACRRAPFHVFQGVLSTTWECFSNMKTRVLEIFDTEVPVSEEQCQWVHKDYGLTITKDWKEKSTLTKTSLIYCRGWFYVLLLSPIWGLILTALFWKKEYFIPFFFIVVVGILNLLPSFVFVIPNVRFLHPLDFGVFLMLGATASYIVQSTSLRKVR